MSLVELMVGMVIGLIGIVIITHIYLVNDQYKRSTTGSGEAQVNGAIALYTLERELRMAGFGINHSAAFGCECAGAGCSAVQYFYFPNYTFPPAASLTGARNAVTLFPVVITPSSPPGGPDTISVFYGNSTERVLATKLQAPMLNPGDDLKTEGTSGFEVNDLIVVVDNQTPHPPATTAGPPYACAMLQVTAIDAAASKLKHAGNGTWNPAAGGTLPAFPDQSLVFDLGARPTWRSFSINNGRLQMTDQMEVLTAGGVSQDVADDIVDLQAMYGKDTNATMDYIPDAWNNTKPTTPDEWKQVVAVRFAVLSRSKEWYKPSVAGGACEATTTANKPTWSLGTFPTIEAAGALPSCYKYRVFETTVPLRNMIWRPE